MVRYFLQISALQDLQTLIEIKLFQPGKGLRTHPKVRHYVFIWDFLKELKGSCRSLFVTFYLEKELAYIFHVLAAETPAVI